MNLTLCRENSAQIIMGDLNNIEAINSINEEVKSLDLLVNNASVFYPNSVESSSIDDWDNILNVNLRAPFFLSQGLSNKLAKNSGSIINIIDIHADRPLTKHAIL